MRKTQTLLLIALSIAVLSGCANTGTVKKLDASDGDAEKEALQMVSARSGMAEGKRFIYLMAWNKIPVGRIVAEISRPQAYKGYDVYVVTLVTESNKFLSRIYRVEDTYTSYVDTRTITSRGFEADRKEGNYRKHVIVEYDFEAMEATYTNLTDGSVKNCPIDPNVQDPVSAMCYFMTLPIRKGEMVGITINLNEKNYELFGKVEDLGIVKLSELGSFPAFRVRPYAELKGERVRKGSAWMYFLATDSRYPLYGGVRIPFGRVTATLRAVEDI